MTVSTDIQNIEEAKAKSHGNFDTVEVCTDDRSTATLFLPLGKGQAVADAINAAVSK